MSTTPALSKSPARDPLRRCLPALLLLATAGAGRSQCMPTWLPIALPAGLVQATTTMPDGAVIAAGLFTSLDGVVVDSIARWNGSTWSPLGAGVAGGVAALAVDANGDLLAGRTAVWRWNGATWAMLGGPLGFIRALTTRANGEVIAVVGSIVMRWNGASWSPLPDLSGLHLRGAATLPNDDVIVVGDGWLPTSGPAPIARWNGAAWSALGGANFGEGFCALVRRSGELLVGGVNLDVPGGTTPLARWTGSSWVALDPALGGQVHSILELPNGDLVVGGALTIQGQPWGGMGRWNGLAWSAPDGGSSLFAANLALSGGGELFASGSFVFAGNLHPFVRATVPCPAAVGTSGSGCTSTAGAVLLQADSLPWAGATFRSTATGMTPLSLALHVVGINALSLPLPFGAPGCALFVDPVVTELLFPVGGSVAAGLALPNTASLAGVAVRTQVVGLEFGPAMNLVRTTSTNALLLTVGAL
jgi:hypothetical protein